MRSLAAASLALAPIALAASMQNRSFGVTTDHALFAQQTYDYLIVGGGSAGLLLANRLSANPRYTVGVIEAGLYQPDEPLINVPGLFGHSLGNASLDWLISTTLQPGIHNRSLPQPRGKVLGGSSALTYHNYNRGSREEYDAWEELGNTGWNWDALFPYFTRLDNVTAGEVGFLPGLNQRPGLANVQDGAVNGPIAVGYNNNDTATTPWVAEWHQSWLNNGAYMNADPEGGNSTGMTLTARPVHPVLATRSYSTNSFLEPALDRKNLFVLTGAEATKIIFANDSLPMNTSNIDESELVACGIEYGTPLNTTQRNVALANIEVILSAGSLKSPQLLELSGVGNRTVLESLGIPVILEFPEVGENLQDHLEFNQDFLLKEDIPYETWDVYRNDPSRYSAAWEEYKANKTGIFNSSPATLGFFPLQTFPQAFNVSELLDELDRELAAADLTPIRKKQFEIQRRHLAEGKVTQLEIAFLAKGGVAHSNYPVLQGRSYLTAITFLLRPYSTGNVHINTTDPFAPALVDPKYNQFSFDWKVAAQWTKLARKVMLTDPIGQYIETPVQPPADTETLEQWDDFCREWTISVWHPIGSTSMAPREIGGVVSPKMVVYGTKNLRIVDAGSMPINIAAHTIATIYAMADKMSDVIINDRRITELNASIRSNIAKTKAQKTNTADAMSD
ncbi:putative GMC oxidoreductase family protein [Lyophyllum shimeji]|uniref:GMC oxidoreductase family protein n=1 Tax=Lyophyllum shimeji TaxID=47721 RepID=A0A9P3PU14_LYOSH|nr:putative GMC oxidoreductase family protein [Lyophyllum shimeji]